VNSHTRDSLKLKAAVEFGGDYTYTIKQGGLGPTLVVNAETKSAARIARKEIPGTWEGLYVLVVYCSSEEEPEGSLYDPNLM
jgi:hypothetical protein